MHHSPLEGQRECFPGREAIARIPEMLAIFVSAKSAVHRVGFALEDRRARGVQVRRSRGSLRHREMTRWG
jgi:hypothetical protein